MCNLGEGIEEKAIAIGEAKGEARGKAKGAAEAEARLVGNMHKNGFTAEQIAALAVFGADNLVIPAMVLGLIVLLLGRKKL